MEWFSRLKVLILWDEGLNRQVQSLDLPESSGFFFIESGVECLNLQVESLISSR